uniref:Uncharacterized protein n=1 Tax=Romanomermis culicivorax TaxID=13658 RepID=A0A915L6C4_ROMCU
KNFKNFNLLESDFSSVIFGVFTNESLRNGLGGGGAFDLRLADEETPTLSVRRSVSVDGGKLPFNVSVGGETFPFNFDVSVDEKYAFNGDVSVVGKFTSDISVGGKFPSDVNWLLAATSFRG